MKYILLIATSLLAVSTLASADVGNYKYPQAEALPQDDTSNFQRDPTLLTGYDLNLSADRFAKAWLSKTNERERIKAPTTVVLSCLLPRDSLSIHSFER